MAIDKTLILNLSKSLTVRFKELNVELFCAVEKNDLELVMEKQFDIYSHRFDSRIYFGEDAEYGLPNELEYISLNIIKVLANLSDEIKQKSKNVGILELQKAIQKCLNETKVPNWLHEKLITYLPPLFIKELKKSTSNKGEETDHEVYLIFLKGNEVLECYRDSLDRFYRKIESEKFDIFMEYTERYRIEIKGNSHVFQAGVYHPFSILSLFLQRLGRTVSYSEIYYLAIKPLEKRRPRDPSKKVYNYLRYIAKALSKVDSLSMPPEEWFQREHNRGIIKVNKGLNSCLIISRDNLAG